MAPLIIGVSAICIVLVLFSRPRSRQGLAPEGGSRLKNALALLLTRLGPKNPDDWRTPQNSDVRVPVPEGMDEKNYNDSWVFQGADAGGNAFLTRLGFRNAGREVELWFWGSHNGERYANDQRSILRETDPDPDGIRAGGLAYEKLGEGLWKITYEGSLNGSPGKAELLWEADAAMFFSPEHMDSLSTARAMAEMPWSRGYFEKMRRENAVRIEQGGLLSGTIEYAGKKITLNMKGIRDHSWGRRDWSFITRYMWTVFALDKPTEVAGITAKYMAISPVNYGDVFNRITTGWIAGDNKVIPVAYTTDMARVGNDGVIPEHYQLLFRSPAHKPVSINIHRRQPEMSWIVSDRKFEVNEAWCGLEVNGTKACGIAEFGYSADRGYFRPFESAKAE